MRTINGDTHAFSIMTGLHHDFTLSPYLFVLFMGELTSHVMDKVPLGMLFAEDIVLINETTKKKGLALS